ncbi:FkbM family methyltransferase [Arenimonas sp.]|nr:FkbM family methyltransferase [Candidatus Parcubacteria bacterium]
MLKKINLNNLISYSRNKIYNSIASVGLEKKIIDKVANSKEVLEKIGNKADGNKDIEIIFKDGYKIICPIKNIEAVAETCINEDYTGTFYQIKSGDVIFDLGANIGSFSVYAAHKGAQVFAFEPDPYNLKYISKNIEINNLQDKITVYASAVAEKIGTVRLSSNDNHACGSIINAEGTTGSIEVPTTTIDTVISEAGIEKISLFKIDVEGAEYLILPSISTANYAKIEKIIGEFHLFNSTPDLNFKKIKQTLQPYFSKIKHKIPYYFTASK